MSIWLEKARDDPVRLMRHVTTSKSHSHPFLFGDTVLFTQERSLLDTCSSGAGARKQPTLWHLSALKGDAEPLANDAPDPTQRRGEQELLFPRHTGDLILFAMEKNVNSPNRPLL